MKNNLKILLGFLILTFSMESCSKGDEPNNPIITPFVEIERVDTFNYISDEVETFIFTTGGVSTEGLIYLPESYATNNNLPAIYLLDFQEQHFTVVTDEYAQLINAVRQNPTIDALVISLKALPNTDAIPPAFQDYCDVLKDMSYYIDSNYTNNSSKTLVARGSEGGVVLLTLLNEDPEANVFDNYIATDSPKSFNDVVIDINQNGTIPEDMPNKKLHFTFTSDNNQVNIIELLNSFEDAQYSWLTFEHGIASGEFSTAYPEVFAAGLEFVFE